MWNEPKVVARKDRSKVELYLPDWNDIPEEFKDSRNKWCRVVSGIFFLGNDFPKVKAGIDENICHEHLDTVLRTWKPSHEHKEAGAAYLMSLWCEFPEG